MTSRENNSESNAERFVVEYIGDRRKKKGIFQYKIFWNGYPAEESTWEPKENVAEELVAAYDKLYQAQPKSSKTKKKIILMVSDVYVRIDANDCVGESSEDDESKSPSTTLVPPININPRVIQKAATTNPRVKKATNKINQSLRKGQTSRNNEVETIVLDSSTDENSTSSPQTSKGESRASNARESRKPSSVQRRSRRLQMEETPIASRSSGAGLSKRTITMKEVVQKTLKSKKWMENGSLEQRNLTNDPITISDSDESIGRRTSSRPAKSLTKKRKHANNQSHSDDGKSMKVGSGSSEGPMSPLKNIGENGVGVKDMARKEAFFGSSMSRSDEESENSQAQSWESLSIGSNDSLDEVAIPLDNGLIENDVSSNANERLEIGYGLPFDESTRYVEADIQGVFGTERINGIRVYSVLLANNSPAYLTTAQIPKSCHYMVMDLLQYMTTINS